MSISKTSWKAREQEILHKEISRAQVIAELDRCISDSSEATSALKTLVLAGCDRKWILWSLYQFCGGNPADARDMKRIFAARRRFLLGLSKRLRRVVIDMEKAKTYLSDMQVEVNFPNDAEQILSLAEFFERYANRVVKKYAWQRASGRDHHLVFLAKVTEEVTGREHYKELADLVTTVRSHYDPTHDQDDTAETLRNLVDRNKPLDIAFMGELEGLRRERALRTTGSHTSRKKT